MTTPLLLLRVVQLGVQIREMDLLTIGTINDEYCYDLSLSEKAKMAEAILRENKNCIN